LVRETFARKLFCSYAEACCVKNMLNGLFVNMKIIADENITFIHEVFGGLGQVETFAGRSITAEQVKGADVLLVRSVTQVNEALLYGSRVKFVGTCTIGTDHIDEVYLARQGIGFSAAPGCNANAVVDYVISTLVVLAQRHEAGFDLFSRCVGIVGVGNVGRRLKSRLEAMGVRCVCSDPLRNDDEAQGFVSLEELFAQADIISLHVPLTVGDEHGTHHLFNAANLLRLKDHTILINTARGPVVDNDALQDVLAQRPDMTAVLDVWECEPEVDVALLGHVTLATPHIAGYSLDGKVRGTQMVYQALCQYFKLPELIDVMSLAPQVVPIPIAESAQQTGCDGALDSVLQCYDVRRDDEAFRQVMTPVNAERAASFDSLRKNYPVRRELVVTPVTNVGNEPLRLALSAVGFAC
jgi:erythronate-4-phosphate dehydrogenase